MESGLSLQALTDQDGPAFAGLSFSSADEGRVHYAANYQADAVEAIRAIHGDVAGVVAREGNTRLVGIGLVRFGRCTYEAEERPFALLSNLIVHPDFRQRGLATRLADWRVNLARERYGERVVILANLQYGNRASVNTVKKWARQVHGPFYYQLLKTRATRPEQPPGIAVRALEEDEYQAFALGLDEFYSGHNLYQPASALDLRRLCQDSPFQTPVRRLYVALNAHGELIAGVAAFEEYRLKVLEIRGLPPGLALVNRVLKILPADGAARQVYLDRIWYRPGYDRAARCLIEHMRWLWHGKASNLSAYFDSRSPLRSLLALSPLRLITPSRLAILADQEMDPKRLVCPIY